MNQILEKLKYEFSKGNGLIKIIYLNVGVFVLMILVNFVLKLFNVEDQSFVYDVFALHADGVEFITKPWTILTYSVFHSGFTHILFNMLLLYFSGQVFLQYLSEMQLISLYIMGVIAGGLLFIVSINLFPLFDNPVEYYKMIGASAGVISVLIAIATYVPNYSMRFPILGNVKLWQIAVLFVFLDFLNFADSGNEGGHISHIGGALIGFIYGKQLHKNNDIGRWIAPVWSKILGLFSRKRQPFQKVYRNQTPKSDYDYNMSKKAEEEKIDKILGKISKSGYESLSAKEKEFLFKAGKK